MKKNQRIIPVNRTTLLLTILGLVGYFSFYSYLLNLFSKVGINSQQYSAVLLSFDPAKIADFYRQLIDSSKLGGYILIHQVNLLNPFLFAFAFFLLSSMIANRLNCPAKLAPVCNRMPLIAILIAVFDLTATSFVLLSTNDPLNFPTWIAYGLGFINLIRYPLLLAFMVWLTITLGSIGLKMIRNVEKRVDRGDIPAK